MADDFTLSDLLEPERLTAVVDIGANPTGPPPPYTWMLSRRLCTLVGFEPQAEALAELNEKKSDLETYLPYAVGDGKPGTLKICQAPGMSSLLTPEPRTLNYIPFFSEFGTVHREIPIETRTLDSITEIGALDFLQIDVQGSELSIFQNGKSYLSKAIAVQTEVSFIPFYKNQPGFGEIDMAMRALGFVPHMFANLEKRMILPVQNAADRLAHINQVIEADIVYVRDFTQPDKMDTEQLKHLAMVAHYCYWSYDLVGNCIYHLINKGVLPRGSVERYLTLVKPGAA